MESRNVWDRNEWKLCPKVLQMIYKKWGTPDMTNFDFHIRFRHTLIGSHPREQCYDKIGKFVPICFLSIRSHRPAFSFSKSQERKSTINSGLNAVASSSMLCNSIANIHYFPFSKNICSRFHQVLFIPRW